MINIPGVGAPCRRALEEEGYDSIESLNGVDYDALSSLHGVGPRALERLQAALTAQGMSLGGNVPAKEDRSATWTRTHTGNTAADIKTHQGSEAELQEFLESLTPRRAEHSQLLLELFGKATGADPVLWGPSMIGYGQAHYVYATGREGDTFQVGFSPRKAKLSLYGIQSTPQWAALEDKLGKHTTGASCVYINKPEDVDLDVLAELVRAAWNAEPGSC